LSKYQR